MLGRYYFHNLKRRRRRRRHRYSRNVEIRLRNVEQGKKSPSQLPLTYARK